MFKIFKHINIRIQIELIRTTKALMAKRKICPDTYSTGKMLFIGQCEILVQKLQYKKEKIKISKSKNLKKFSFKKRCRKFNALSEYIASQLYKLCIVKSIFS
ncbi:hypothetical protein BpHYR1_044071 [Brachionus plicatilis]|uniref:Uncharacterized protein n=1 Tax=Brachionus plicatilis TaxID=10195 RepID=A0A3M7PHA3_BRAPC|nr:hypothetical protein BpHYR1_044071 [Brachionus plicatilis]